MNELDEWMAAACGAVGLSPGDVAPDRDRVLGLARDVAHDVLRPAAPLAAYLLGVAVGRGSEPGAAADAIAALARSWPGRRADTAEPPD